MTKWKKKIIDAFIDHYFASAPETGEDRGTLRIRSSLLFPNFDTATPDEKVSYLEAAKTLERKGTVNLSWERHCKGERLKTLSCENFEKLFQEAGRPFPKTEAENIRAMLADKVSTLKAAAKQVDETDKIIALLEFLSLHFGPRETGQGFDQKAIEELIRFLEFMLHPAHPENLSTRALSILLYRDSKRLENLLSFCRVLLSRMEIISPVPDFTFLERSYPETLIAGKITITFKDSQSAFSNDGAYILGFPLETVEKIKGIGHISGKDERYVLTIENKETFYALARPQKRDASE